MIYYVRAVHFAATILAVGAIFFFVFVAAPACRKSGDPRVRAAVCRQLAFIAWPSLALAVISGAAWLVLIAASMSGQPPADVFSGDVLWTVLSQTHFGLDWMARLILACLTAATLVPLLSAPHRAIWIDAVAVIMATALVGTLAWAGHAAGGEGVEAIVHPAADFLHLVAAAAWVGALVPLALLLSMTGADANALVVARIATLRFSMLGIVSVATLLFTGIVNSWYLVGSIPALTESDYGRLLLIKLALFLGMVGIAAVNWSRLTPKLIQNADAVAAQNARRQLRRNATIEASFGAIIITIVGVLGTLPPASHAQHHAIEGAIPADASFQHIHSEDGMADVMIEPGRAGTARATIRLWNGDSGPLEAQQVTFTLTAPAPGSTPTTRSAVQVSDGAWQVDGIELSQSGNWMVTVDAVLGPTSHLVLNAPIVIKPSEQ